MIHFYVWGSQSLKYAFTFAEMLQSIVNISVNNDIVNFDVIFDRRHFLLLGIKFSTQLKPEGGQYIRKENDEIKPPIKCESTFIFKIQGTFTLN